MLPMLTDAVRGQYVRRWDRKEGGVYVQRNCDISGCRGMVQGAVECAHVRPPLLNVAGQSIVHRILIVAVSNTLHSTYQQKPVIWLDSVSPTRFVT